MAGAAQSGAVSKVARGRSLGRYELVAEIASGGMGTVFLARVEGVGGFTRLFAIKVLHPHLAKEEQFVSMFLDEARLAARLHHPNAVGIVDVDDSDLGYYLVMEYVDGFTLEQLLSRVEDPEERIRLGLRALVDATNGLHAAHELKDDHGNPLGIVHRDVSPQNILIGMDGIARITDFGVARAAERITSSRPGMLKGKPSYMAPEQAKGGALDARADVFALGIILWEILAGDMLFPPADVGPAVILMNVASGELARPKERNPDVPDLLDELCMKALVRPLEERFESARKLSRALEEAASAAGMLASSHQLADAMVKYFEDDAEARRAAIARRMSQMGDEAELPATTSDVYQVPKLQSSSSNVSGTGAVTRASRNKSGPWHESGAGEGAEAFAHTVASGARAAAEVEAPPVSSVTTGSGADPAASGVPVRLAVGLGVVGLVMLALAVWLGARSGSPQPPASGAPAAAADDHAPPGAATAEPIDAPQGEAVEHGAGAEQGEAVEHGAGAARGEAVEPAENAEATAEAVEAAVEPTEPEPATSESAERPPPPAPSRPHRHRPERPQAAAPAAMAEPPAPPSMMAPTLEDNPYLRH